MANREQLEEAGDGHSFFGRFKHFLWDFLGGKFWAGVGVLVGLIVVIVQAYPTNDFIKRLEDLNLEGEFTVKESEEYTISETRLDIETFTLEQGSTLWLDDDLQELEINANNVNIVGSKTKIVAYGRDGNTGNDGEKGGDAGGDCKEGGDGKKGQKGVDGSDGKKITINTKNLTINGTLTVDVHGGNGGMGGDGGSGANGGKVDRSDKCSGGKGGKGGDAGDGWNGGTLEIHYSKLHFNGSENAASRAMKRIIFKGDGGSGGKPGKFGKGVLVDLEEEQSCLNKVNNPGGQMERMGKRERKALKESLLISLCLSDIKRVPRAHAVSAYRGKIKKKE